MLNALLQENSPRPPARQPWPPAAGAAPAPAAQRGPGGSGSAAVRLYRCFASLARCWGAPRVSCSGVGVGTRIADALAIAARAARRGAAGPLMSVPWGRVHLQSRNGARWVLCPRAGGCRGNSTRSPAPARDALSSHAASELQGMDKKAGVDVPNCRIENRPAGL